MVFHWIVVSFVLLNIVVHQSFAKTIVKGEGATLPALVYQAASTLYQFEQKDVSILYNQTSSSLGQRSLLDGKIDFAASDSVLSPIQYEKAPDHQLLPTLATAIVPIFNMPNTNQLVLTQQALADIFSGRITQWNDSSIADVNPNITLPHAPIIVAVRFNGSGTTYIFTQALSSFSELWRSQFGISDSIAWTPPRLLHCASNAELVAQVLANPYSIGYSVWDEAINTNVSTIQLINYSGWQVSVSHSSIRSAISQIGVHDMDDRLAGSAINLPGRNVWPITSFTYIIIRRNTTTNCQSKQAAHFFWEWFYSSPSMTLIAERHGFVALSSELQRIVLVKIRNEFFCDANRLLTRWELYRPIQFGGDVALNSLLSLIEVGYMGNVGSASRHMFDMDISTVPNDESLIDLIYNNSIDIALLSDDNRERDGLVKVEYTQIPIGFRFNIPGIKKQLTFKLDTIVDILSGTICYWNHSSITLENPSIQLPHAPINVVMLSNGEHATNRALKRGMLWSNLSASFTPCQITYESTRTRVEARILSQSYSFGFIQVFGRSLTSSINVYIPCKSISSVAPTHSKVSTCVHSSKDCMLCVQFNVPLMIIAKRVHVPLLDINCTRAHAIAQTFKWLMNRDVFEYALEAMNLKFKPTSTSIADALTCNGISLLHPPVKEVRIEPSSQIKSFALLLCLIGFMICLALLIANTYYRNEPYIKMSAPLINNVILIGSMFAFATVAFLTRTRQFTSFEPLYCSIQRSSFSICFTICFGCLFAKTYRVYRIFSDKLDVVTMKNGKVFRIILALVAVDVIILTLWLYQSPYKRWIFQGFNV